MGDRLFVGNLSFKVTEATLRAAFSSCGDVREVRLALDRHTGRSRGSAFVQMGSWKEAADAIERMDGTLLEGRPLRVSEAGGRQRGGPLPPEDGDVLGEACGAIGEGSEGA